MTPSGAVPAAMLLRMLIPAEVLDGFGGVATRAQLIRSGLAGWELTAGVRDGTIRRIRRGYYAARSATAEQFAAVRIGGRLGCVSAAKSHGLWSSAHDHLHVTLAKNAARLRTNALPSTDPDPLTPDLVPMPVRLHWIDVAVGGRNADACAWRVDVRTSLSEVARCASRSDIRAVFESAVAAERLDLVTAQRLLVSSVPLGFAAMTLSGDSGSGAESYLVEILTELGLAFRQQVSFGGIGRVDFLVEGRLIVEVDGFAFHRDRQSFERDRARDAALLARGFPTLRIPARVVTDAPDLARAMLLGALAGLDLISA